MIKQSFSPVIVLNSLALSLDANLFQGFPLSLSQPVLLGLLIGYFWMITGFINFNYCTCKVQFLIWRKSSSFWHYCKLLKYTCSSHKKLVIILHVIRNMAATPCLRMLPGRGLVLWLTLSFLSAFCPLSHNPAPSSRFALSQVQEMDRSAVNNLYVIQILLAFSLRIFVFFLCGHTPLFLFYCSILHVGHPLDTQCGHAVSESDFAAHIKAGTPVAPVGEVVVWQAVLGELHHRCLLFLGPDR